MIKIGRYGITFSPVYWFQTHAPTRIWRFLWFWLLREDRASDIDVKRTDEKPRYPPNTRIMQDGMMYYYWKAGEEIHSGSLIEEVKE